MFILILSYNLLSFCEHNLVDYIDFIKPYLKQIRGCEL